MSYKACFVNALGLGTNTSGFQRNALILQRQPPYATPLAKAPQRRARSLLQRTITSKVQTATELEEIFLDSLRELEQSAGDVSLHRYRKLQPDKFEKAAAAVRALEQSNGGFGASKGKLQTLLPGNWKLLLTDSVAVEKNAGSITGLGSLPGAKCKSVVVELNRDGKARTVEGIEVFLGLMKGENALIGKWRLAGKTGRTLEVTYASALLMGKTTVRADSKAVLETTYCSERLRVGKSEGGDFYVFVREE